MLWERILTGLTGPSLIVLCAVILVKSEKAPSFFIILDATQKNFKRILICIKTKMYLYKRLLII